jgi:multiple sugar transport system substrate-binding protein
MHARQFVLYASNGMIVPIDDVIERAGVDLTKYPKVLLDAYNYDGKQYALPRNFNMTGLYYNRELLDAAGVPYPDATWTWDDLKSAAAQATNPSAGTFGFAAPLTGQTGFWSPIYQNEGEVISEDMTTSGYDLPETVEALDWWNGFIRDGSSPTHQQMTETSPFALFQSGKVAMLFEGDWSAGTFAADAALAEKVDVAVLPQGRKRASIMHGSGNVVSANARNPEAAAALVEYLASEEAQNIQSEMGLSGPPSVLGAIDVWADSLPQFSLSVFKDQVEDAVFFPHSRDTTAWQALETEYLTPYWAGETDVETATSGLAAAMNDVLAREQA